MNLNRQVTLESKLLRIRPLLVSDFDGLYEAANDPLIWEQHPAHRYKRDVFKTFFEESIETGGALVIIDNSTNKIIGSSRFNIIPGKDDAVEIGWSFLQRKYWGGEYNRLFKSMMMSHAFQTIPYVLYYVDFENIRSQKAMEKLGGYLLDGDEYLSYKKGNKDHKIYIIRREDWKSK